MDGKPARKAMPLTTEHLPVALISAAIAIFGIWWGQADPKPRIDKLESIQLDNRKELSSALADIRKEAGDKYVTLREHRDLVDRMDGQLSQLRQRDTLFVSKDEFNAWRVERNELIRVIQERQTTLRADMGQLVSRAEVAETNTNVRSRIDKLYQLHDQIQGQITDLFKLYSRPNNTSSFSKSDSARLRDIEASVNQQNDRLLAINYRLTEIGKKSSKKREWQTILR